MPSCKFRNCRRRYCCCCKWRRSGGFATQQCLRLRHPILQKLASGKWDTVLGSNSLQHSRRKQKPCPKICSCFQYFWILLPVRRQHGEDGKHQSSHWESRRDSNNLQSTKPAVARKNLRLYYYYFFSWSIFSYVELVKFFFLGGFC